MIMRIKFELNRIESFSGISVVDLGYNCVVIFQVFNITIIGTQSIWWECWLSKECGGVI